MDLEHQKETDLNTYLIFACLSRDRNVVCAFQGTSSHEQTLSRSFSRLQFPHLLVLHSGALDTPDPHREGGPGTVAVKYRH